MRIQLRNISKSTVVGILIFLGFTIPILIIPLNNSIFIYKNHIWTYDTGDYIKDMEFSYDGSYYVVSTSSSLLLFHKSSPIPIWEYNSIKEMRPVSISASGNYFAGVDWDNLYVFSRDGNFIDLRLTKTSDWLDTVDISRNGEYFVVTDYKTLYLYSTSTFLPIWSFTSRELFGKAEISADGSYIVALDSNYLYVFSKFSNISLWRYPIENRSQEITISANGKYILLGEYSVVGKYPKTLYLFNRESPMPIWSMDFDKSIRSIAISDDGSIFAAGNSEGSLYLFRSTSSTPIFTYNAPWSIYSLSISSDGKNIAAASTVSYLCCAAVGCPCPKPEGEFFLFNFESSFSSWWYNISYFISSCSISADGRSVLAGSRNNLYYFQNKL